MNTTLQLILSIVVVLLALVLTVLVLVQNSKSEGLDAMVGGAAETFVPDITGKRVMQVRAERCGNRITLTVTGGSFTIDAEDDALHSNTDLTVTGGSFCVASGDDALHADAALLITGGALDITKSYEGLEATEEDIGKALAVICRHNNITMDELKEQYDATLEQAVINSVLTGKVMQLIRAAAVVEE